MADLASAFALAVALRAKEKLVRVTTDATGKGEVSVIAGEFHVALNGGKPQKHSDIDAVVRAVAKS